MYSGFPDPGIQGGGGQRPLFWVGVDLNTAGHIAVAAEPVTGEVRCFGRSLAALRRSVERTGSKKGMHRKKQKKTMLRMIRDQNHAISTGVVEFARDRGAGIRMERLFGKRQGREISTENHELWLFYTLQKTVVKRAEMKGIPVEFVNPTGTSKRCSRCGETGVRQRKYFFCPSCGYEEHADVNAALNIAAIAPLMQQKERPGKKVHRKAIAPAGSEWCYYVPTGPLPGTCD
ncbi:MAG: putative transposase [Methanofollis sp.]|nr:putative transposase [Methanofollis sp.]